MYRTVIGPVCSNVPVELQLGALYCPYIALIGLSHHPHQWRALNSCHVDDQMRGTNCVHKVCYPCVQWHVLDVSGADRNCFC